MSTSVTKRTTRPGVGLVERTSERWRTMPTPARWLVYLLLAVGALLLPSDALAPSLSPANDWPSLLFNPIGLYVLLAVGLNVVVGYAGLLDLGYVAFFAIGAYTMAILGVDHGWNFWEALPVAIALSMAAGILLGTPTLRLRGDYLAIVTLGFGEIIRVTANNISLTNGPRGLSQIPHPPSTGASGDPFFYGVIDAKPYYYIVVGLIIAVIVIAKRLESSRVGRAWNAIREDEEAAALMGVPTLKFKLWAFAIGAAIAGGGGALYATRQGAIVPSNFPFQLSALILAAVVLGGAGNLPGVMLGAFLVAWLPERFRGFQEYRFLVFGAALVLLMNFRPEGLIPSRRRRAELSEGTGGMGGLGGEVGAAATQHSEVTP